MLIRALIALSFIASGAIPAGADTFDDGQRSYAEGDYQTALGLWEPLARQGDSAAQYNLGLMYDEGRGVAADPALAVEWYRRAAEAGNVEAQVRLADILLDGLGVPADPEEAAAWLERAAAKNHPGAQFKLGTLYANGIGVERSLGKATEWYAKANDNSCMIETGTGQRAPQSSQVLTRLRSLGG